MKVALLQSRADFARELAQLVENRGHDVDALVTPMSRADRIAALLRNDYDLVQVDETFRGGVVGAVVSSLRDIPLVLYVRGWSDYTNENDDYGRLTDATIRARTRFVLRDADEVVYISGACRNRMREVYPAPEGRVIPRPFDADNYRTEPRDRENTDEDTGELVLLTVTNLRYKGKFEGVKRVLEACEPLFTEYDLRYRVAGNGRYLSDLRSFLDDYDHADRVDVLGYREDVPDLLASADAFVYVSFNDAYPTAVLEAQAAGLPIVAGDEVGVPEAVGGAGLVCDPTVPKLRGGLRDIVSDEALRTDLAEQSRSRMETYNERIADQFLALWQEQLQS